MHHRRGALISRRRLALGIMLALVGCATPSQPESRAARPAAAATAATTDTQPRPKNVAPGYLDSQLVERPMPKLPDAVQTSPSTEAPAWMARLCFNVDGRLVYVSVLAGIPGADGAIVSTLRGWRIRPQPQPICSLVRFVFDVRPPAPKR